MRTTLAKSLADNYSKRALVEIAGHASFSNKLLKQNARETDDKDSKRDYYADAQMFRGLERYARYMAKEE